MRIAIARNMDMVKQLLNGKPSAETLATIFPQVHTLRPVDRYHRLIASWRPAYLLTLFPKPSKKRYARSRLGETSV